MTPGVVEVSVALTPVSWAPVVLRTGIRSSAVSPGSAVLSPSPSGAGSVTVGAAAVAIDPGGRSNAAVPRVDSALVVLALYPIPRAANTDQIWEWNVPPAT